MTLRATVTGPVTRNPDNTITIATSEFSPEALRVLVRFNSKACANRKLAGIETGDFVSITGPLDMNDRVLSFHSRDKLCAIKPATQRDFSTVIHSGY